MIIKHDVKTHVCICSSGDRAVVSGATCRGFESLQMCWYFSGFEVPGEKEVI